MQLSKILITTLLITGLFTFTSCDEDPVEAQQNIVELAQSTPELSTLVAALQRADLVSALEAAGDKTVFAPTNEAFQALLDSNPAWNSLEDIDAPTLTSVLLFHVVGGANVKAEDLQNGYVSTLATGPDGKALSLQVDLTNGVVFNGAATPKSTNVEASNGIIHIINDVMLPPSVVNLALNNSDFSVLVSALTRSDLNTDYVSILSGNGPFTVFAPTNQAFLNLLDATAEWNTLEDIPTATLEAVLNYHVVNGANVQASQLSDNQEITLLGGTATVDLASGAKLETTSGQSVNIILTDVQGTNGVVHVIEEILLP